MNALRRELQVAFSKKAQPLWFRVVKWAVLVSVAITLHGTRYFWPCVLGLPVLGILLHLFYRWKTKGWTRPWGGWNDLDAAGSE